MFDFKYRKNKVFDCIVTAYIEMGMPVGSDTLCRRSNLNLSPATIRSIMRELEGIGYLMHPHISAGRVPTDAGYRYYIDNIMESEKVTRQEQENIRAIYDSAKGQMEILFERSLKILSDFTNQASIILFPKLKRNLLKELKLVSLRENKALAILIATSGLIKSKEFECADVMEDLYLKKIAIFINNACTNKPFSEIKNIINTISLLASDSSYYLCKDALHILERIDIANEIDKLSLGGTHYLFEQPEFQDIAKSERLFKAIEEKRELLRFIEENLGFEGVKVWIGKENTYEAVQDCSIIVSGYGSGDNLLGAIGIIGPTRMPYKRVMPILDCVAEQMSDFF